MDGAFGARPRELMTRRLRLAALRPGDRAALIAMLTDEGIGRTYMVPELRTQEARDRLFERLRTLSEAEDRFVYGIFLSDRLIGMIHEVALREDAVELGYFIAPAAQNRGYAAEALRAAVETLFSMGVPAVTAGAFAENAASLRVMEKCGLRPTGETETLTYRGEERLCVYCAIRADASQSAGRS